MSTNQIYVESTYDEYRNGAFLKEFISDNELMNMSPSIFKTSDSVMNVVWTTIGFFEIENDLSTIISDVCLENPLLVLRNSSGVFDVSKTGVVIDEDNKPITNVEAPVSIVTFDGKGVMIFGFKNDALRLFIGYIKLVGDVETYQITQQIVISEDVPSQRVSVCVGLDRRILVVYVDSNSMLKGKITSDYGCTFSDISVVPFNVPEISSSTLNNFNNQQLITVTNNSGVVDNNIFSCNSSDSYNLFATLSITQNALECYPGVFFDMKSFNSVYVSFLRDKDTSPNNSNIIVMRSDNGSLTFFTLRE